MDMSSLASLYGSALSASETDSVRERAGSRHSALPDERTLQLLLLEGRFGFSFTDDLGRSVRILDCGDWNKSAGPDFLNARIQLDGVPYTGDMELDSSPEDWERHNHGSNSAFDGVILHLACTPSRKEWFTRNSRHERIPLAIIPASMLHGTEALPAAAPDRSCRHAEVLETMPAEQLEILLQSAAAYRFQLKHRRHAQRGGLTTPSQLLYENLAETLGYHANKNAMRHLAQRAPLHALRDCPEALLFGTAGFLVPVLPDSCTPEAIAIKGCGSNGGPCASILNWRRNACSPGRCQAAGQPTIPSGASVPWQLSPPIFPPSSGFALPTIWMTWRIISPP